MSSPKFNLNDYEPVKARKKRFYADHKDGRIIVEAIQITDTNAVLKAILYKNKEEQEKGLPFATGHAFEQKGAGSFANKTSWTENCEESAIGRALDNAGYAGNDKCSKEEIVQAQKHSSAPVGPISELSQTMIEFGKYKGQKFKDVNIENLVQYRDWLVKTAEAENKPIQGKVLSFVESVSAYADAPAQQDDIRW